ncbi:MULTISPECIES: VanZ family protein [unclassified Cytobacillus]|uniref:VanZ family protein n=1 Tax=unclassified Cytobacillus TaxID=2675268 RepID=UPI00204035B2|nr:VanZ family protein [Cytobacillus sp. AMY 15.2]MCM3093592.1 VanZ family protein [Cytobacillus sp. AMY 15.2]
MESMKQNQTKITAVLLAIYLLVLIWIIPFKMQSSIQDLRHFTDFREINFIPFAGSANAEGRIDSNEIILNVLAFIPFGIYISMLKPNWSFLKKVVPVAGASLLFEVLQLSLR